MFYQNILTEIAPYQVRVSRMMSFGEHRHGDIELHYCVKGDLCITVDKKIVSVRQGEVLLISPMVSHAVPSDCHPNALSLTAIVGVSFLKNFFSYFSDAKEKSYLIRPISCPPLFEVLAETAKYVQEKTATGDLLVRGNLYKICAFLIDMISVEREPLRLENREIKKVSNIEKALEMIYDRHAENLTLQDAAAATGYSKSNFCKIFKSITGDTFHGILNRQRVESACGLLSETNLPVSEIAVRVGFLETKTFCRVFKTITSFTPTEYRKKQK